MNREPVRTEAIRAAIMSFLAMVVGFGVVAITPEQMDNVDKFLLACLPLVPGVYVWVRKEIVRSQVTPLVDPRDNNGQRLVPEK